MREPSLLTANQLEATPLGIYRPASGPQGDIAKPTIKATLGIHHGGGTTGKDSRIRSGVHLCVFSDGESQGQPQRIVSQRVPEAVLARAVD